jgi:hypothetical protein
MRVEKEIPYMIIFIGYRIKYSTLILFHLSSYHVSLPGVRSYPV